MPCSRSRCAAWSGPEWPVTAWNARSHVAASAASVGSFASVSAGDSGRVITSDGSRTL